MWNIIIDEHGDYLPKDELGMEHVEIEYTNKDILRELISKTTLMFHSALSPGEFFRVSHLKKGKEIRDALQVAHEGTTGVKERRVEQFVSEFHSSFMKEGETIRVLEIRFTHLINNMTAIGRMIP